MIKSTPSKLTASFVILFLIFGSCKSESNDNAAATATDTVAKSSETEPTATSEVKAPSFASVSGKLDTLWVLSDSFLLMDRNKNIAFSYYANLPDTLTLHGWTVKNNKFDPHSNLRLLKGRPSSVTADPPVYLGNQVLEKQIVKAIQEQINSTHGRYVIFAPDRLSPSNRIVYNIYVVDFDPRPSFVPPPYKLLASPGATNPSPPRTYE